MGAAERKTIFIPMEMEEEINNPLDWPNCSIEHPWLYKGWYIWRWTGWKGCWQRKNPLYSSDDQYGKRCKLCGKIFENWDIIYTSQGNDDILHAECAQNDHRWLSDGSITGQWVAMNSNPAIQAQSVDTKYMYSSAPGRAGFYERGGCFDIEGPQRFTYYTPPEELYAAREEALRILYDLINSEVNQCQSMNTNAEVAATSLKLSLHCLTK
jgi:hypothetical protein